MNKKVVVMSAQDVAELRKQKKEIENAYHEAKAAAFEFIADEMKRTGKEYTAMELAGLSGLGVSEISANLYNVIHNIERFDSCTRNIKHRVASREAFTEEHFIHVLPNGEVNPNNTIVIRKRKNLYSAK